MTACMRKIITILNAMLKNRTVWESPANYLLDIKHSCSFQVLDILEYACGLKLGPALTLSKNPFFEMASTINNMKYQTIIAFLRADEGGLSP